MLGDANRAGGLFSGVLSDQVSLFVIDGGVGHEVVFEDDGKVAIGLVVDFDDDVFKSVAGNDGVGAGDAQAGGVFFVECVDVVSGDGGVEAADIHGVSTPSAGVDEEDVVGDDVAVGVGP